MLQGLPRECIRDSNGRLCFRKEYYGTPAGLDNVRLEYQGEGYHACELGLESHGRVGL